MPIIRPMTARNAAEPHRAATQLELFFDLVSVIAIAALTEAFHHAISAGHGLDTLPGFLFLFLAVWWAWMNYTWFASAFDNDDAVFRVLTIVIMGGALLFAAGMAHIFATLDMSWGVLGWSIMRLSMAGLWWRAGSTNPDHMGQARRHILGLTVAQLGWIAILFLVEPGSPGFFAWCGLAFAVELATPVWGTWQTRLPFHRHHIIERFGLLNIIVLGEVLLSISLMFGSLYDGHGEAHLIVTAVSGLVIVFTLWWIYFLEEEHLNGGGHRQAFVWGYGHYLVFLGGALLAAGLGAQMDVLTDHSQIDMHQAALVANCAAAIYLGAIWLVRDRYHALGSRQWALPVMALALLGAGLGGAEAWVTAVLCVAALVWRMAIREAPAG